MLKHTTSPAAPAAYSILSLLAAQVLVPPEAPIPLLTARRARAGVQTFADAT